MISSYDVQSKPCRSKIQSRPQSLVIAQSSHIFTSGAPILYIPAMLGITHQLPDELHRSSQSPFNLGKHFFVDEMYEMSAGVFEKKAKEKMDRDIGFDEELLSAKMAKRRRRQRLEYQDLLEYYDSHLSLTSLTCIAYLVEQKKCFPPHVYISIDSKTSLTCKNWTRRRLARERKSRFQAALSMVVVKNSRW